MALALASVLGSTFLFVFYRAVQVEWPEGYFGATDLSSYSVSAHPLKYLAFRLGPVYATCLFVAVTLDRADAPATAGALLTGLLHGSTSVGRAFFDWVRSEPTVRRHRAPRAVFYAVVLVGVLVAALLASLSRGLFAPIVPDASELSATLWTAVLAGIIGAYLTRVARHGGLTENEMVADSRRRIPPHLWDAAGAAAEAHGVDADLVHAVMIVENLERPPWTRALERLKGRVLPSGTYGIMQVWADRPITDEESIQRAVERFVGVDVIGDGGLLDRQVFKAFAARYNPDLNFAMLLENAYYHIWTANQPADDVASDVQQRRVPIPHHRAHADDAGARAKPSDE